jgi:hypothetical protein
VPEILLAIAVVAAVAVCLCVIVILRARRHDEGERFRHVASLTSAWSRDRPGVEPDKNTNATESVDSR